MLSVPRAAVDIPAWEGPRGLKHSHDLSCDEDKLLEVLKARVFGVGVDRVPRAMKESARRVGQSQEGVVAPGCAGDARDAYQRLLSDCGKETEDGLERTEDR